MSNIYYTLKMDISRGILSFKFIFTCVLVTLILFLGAYSEFKFSKDVLYLYKYSIEVSGFGYLIPLLSAFPYSGGF